MTRLVRSVVMLAALCIALRLTATTPTAQPAPGAPSRIISLVPATTEMLYAMGAGGRVVGVGSYDRFPPEIERLPKLGGLLDPDTEQLLALRPDLVIVYDTQADLRRRLDRARIPQWSYGIKGLADVTSGLRDLGRRIGSPREADAAAAQVEASLQAVRQRVAGRPRPRTLLVFGRDPGSLRGINASGGYGFLHDLLELAGADDVLADLKQAAVPMSTEMVLARAPQLILELHYGQPLPASRLAAEQAVWNALPAVPAVRGGRVRILSGDEFVVPGPRVTIAAERLARAIHPDAFP